MNRTHWVTGVTLAIIGKLAAYFLIYCNDVYFYLLMILFYI